MPLEISPKDLNNVLARGEPLLLVDCREPWENEHVRLEGSLLIPMNDTPDRLEELRSSPGRLVIYCHHGIRSMQVAHWLRSQGFEEAQSLAGGIDSWSLQIDPELPRY